ncbi:MAG: Ribonuclease PH [candidate division TM6 bacterium GW2011_GWE2_42_60]|nr:MAG: Ribonuclease PH [candidate division TM6 bacterium GW2011_GWE2_42_60]
MEKGFMYPRMRSGNRAPDDLRPIKVTYDVFEYAAGSVLFELGRTKVFCAVTLQTGVPHFLRGKRRGWLTAEYSLLPVSTPIRTVREVTSNKRNGRTIEISRLVGRALRAVSNLQVFGEQTVFIDCDVVQADGGTRIACITGAFLALKAAEATWKARGVIPYNFLKDDLAAVSVGINSQGAFLDMDFAEDSAIDADFNFVLTRSGTVVEVQGSSEREPISWEDFDLTKAYALKGARELFEFFDMNQYQLPERLHQQPQINTSSFISSFQSEY